jgi:phospholipid-binding lipoprotein MlaA
MRARHFAAGMASTIAILNAAPALAHAPGDPFEKLNRRGFAIQEGLDRYVVGPLGFIYQKLTPGPIGKAIHHIMVNLTEPTVVINDMLQIRPRRAGEATIRFVVNTTVGVGGMIDVTGATGLPHHKNSFGDTLGRYGVKPGPYLFLPLVGPTTLRDLFGNGVDAVTDPLHFIRYPQRTTVSISLAVVGGLDQWSHSMNDLRTLLTQAADPYATLRSSYLQHREAEIRGETAPPAALPDLDAPGAAPTPQASDQASLVTPPDETAAFNRLPNGQDGNSDHQVAGALDQGQGQSNVGWQAEQRGQEGIAGFLNADAHRGDENGAAHGHDQGLQPQDIERIDGDAGDAQRDPGAQGAGRPGAEMHAGPQPEAADSPVKFGDEITGLCGAFGGGGRDRGHDACEDPHAMALN